MNTKWIILIFSLTVLFSCTAKEKVESNVQTIYLVRHAEKADDGTKDPPLTEEGRIRAEKIAFMLSDADITKVYSTDYSRTRETANPLANLLATQIEIYDPRNTEDFVKKILSEKANVLVVGHSNTTPLITNALASADQYESIDESDYSNLFIVNITGNKVSTLRLHF